MNTATKRPHLSLVYNADAQPHKGTCPRCGHTEIASGYDATYQALMRHWNTEHRTPPKNEPAKRWPWRGKANKTQITLLRMAERGELQAYLCHVTDLSRAPALDLDPILGNLGADTPWSSWRWYPSRLTGWQSNFLPGLIAAKLILPPKPPVEKKHMTTGLYRITPIGRAVLRTAHTNTEKEAGRG